MREGYEKKRKGEHRRGQRRPRGIAPPRVAYRAAIGLDAVLPPAPSRHHGMAPRASGIPFLGPSRRGLFDPRPHPLAPRRFQGNGFPQRAKLIVAHPGNLLSGHEKTPSGLGGRQGGRSLSPNKSFPCRLPSPTWLAERLYH